MEIFIIITTILLIGIGFWQVKIMRAQQPVGSVIPQVRWYRKYWPILVMSVILLLNWIPLFLRPASDIVHFPKDFHFTEVRGKSFQNERVVLDGYKYVDCSFQNVTFVWNGTKPTQIHGATINGVWLYSNSDSISETVELLKAMEWIKETVPIKHLD